MSLRRWLANLNLAAAILLLAVLFILVNFIASRRYARSDLTRTKITALSGKTAQILGQVRGPLTVTVFYQPSHPLYDMVKDLLTEYQHLSPNLQVQYVDPDQDIARARQLAKQFEVEKPNLVIFQAGSKHKYLSDTDLAEYDYTAMSFGGQPTLKAFKGEDAFTSAILNVTQARQPLVWMSSGHGEQSLDDPEPMGLAELKKYLERDNMTLEPAILLEKTEVPAPVNAVLIAGPTRRFVEQELALLQGYLDRGGRLLVLLDPLQETGLEELLATWGASVGNNIVVDPAQQIPFISAANLFVTTYTRHPIVEKMQTLMTLFPLARSVQPAKDRADLRATALAFTSAQGWGETDTQVEEFQFQDGTDLKGPVPIAVAVEKTAPPATRLVVIGDSDFVANGQLSNVGNLDFILGAFHWLVSQEQLIGIGPKPLEAIKLNLTAAQMSRLFWFSFAGLPVLFGLLGIGMWWLRRR
ncbi:MAG: GldG family protein [Candidatus Omnitrophica bacterium]|nr:GldG family protein [Candidatus Omnitrophota bacterium]